MEAYRSAIFSVVRRGDVVLDVGAGTGILSIFATQAGARRVYAVEHTPVAQVAQRIVEVNRLEDRVQVIEQDIESADLPEKVDVIVSEWMGWYAVDENLLCPLLLARDRWLKPEGRMVPGRVGSWMAPVWDHLLDAEMDFWRGQPHGVELGPIAEGMALEPMVSRSHLSGSHLLAEPQRLWSIDLLAQPIEQPARGFAACVLFPVTREGKMSALAAWFEAELAPGVLLTNAPDAPETHWGRAVFPLGRTMPVHPGTEIAVEFLCEPAGPGQTRARWSVRVGDGPWEQHDSRPDASVSF